MAITLSNGHKFEYMAASGAMAFNGQGWFWEQPLRLIGLFDPSLFTVVLKTITLFPKKGNLKWYNPLGCIRIMHEGINITGVANAVGLTNNGFDWWRKEIGPKLNSKKFPAIVSLSGTHDDIVSMAQRINKANFDLVGIEINASCPNAREKITRYSKDTIKACEKIKKYTNLPIILKLSFVHNESLIVKETEEFVEAYSINSVPWSAACPGKESPLAHLGGGGVSGKCVQALTWTYLEKIIFLTKRPVIASSIWSYEDIETVRKLGAKAIGFGSVFIPYPWRPTLFAKRDMKEMRDTN